MHPLDWLTDFPLQAQQTQPREPPLAHYMPPHITATAKTTDLPCQLTDNPYHPHKNSNRIPTLSNHSLSKWAFTEISTQDQKDEDSILPLEELELVQERIIEATFKPKELKEHLRAGNSLRRLLKNTLEGEIRVEKGSDKVGVKKERERGKTRYQKILEEQFSRKRRAETDRVKVNVVKPSRQGRARHESHRSNVPSSITREKPQSFCSINLYPQRQSQQQLPSYRDALQEIPSKPTSAGNNRLTKTYSQQTISHMVNPCKNIQRKESVSVNGRQSWTKMSFSQRQEKVLQNRKEKENKGQRLNIQRQTKQCSFKPVTRTYRGGRQEDTVGSYAKQYFKRLTKQR